jgi:CRP-like cAMP-binding protein
MKIPYDLTQLFKNQPGRVFRKREVISTTGQELDGLFWITSGRVKVSALTEDGQEYTLNTIGPGDPFPLPHYFAMPTPIITYTAETHVKTAWRPRAEVDEYFHAHPEVLYQIMRLVLTVLYARINTLSRGSAEEKVVKRLIELSQRFGKPGQDAYDISITQQELASSVSLSRESVNLVLKKLQSKGILTMGRNKICLSMHKAKAELLQKVTA